MRKIGIASLPKIVADRNDGKSFKIGICSFLAVALGVLFFVNSAAAQDVEDHVKRLGLESLVNEAAELILNEGEDGLSVIAEKDGPFCKGDTYVFITSGETGADLINPAFEAIEGMPVENYTNPDAKAAQLIIVEAVKDNDTAWVEYLWPKPGQTKMSKKISYLRKINVNGKVRIVGAGYYPEE